MAEENLIQTNIVANANFAPLISDLNKVTLALTGLQEKLNASNKALATQAAVMNKAFAETLRSTGQFSTHFVSLTSDVEKFGSQLDKGQIKLGQFFRIYRDHLSNSGGIIRDLAKQQVQMQNAILQPLGRNAEGLMQYNVHIPRGLDLVANKTKIASQELSIMNRFVQEGAGQLINWGKNTQWAGRQLTVGLTVPMAAFGKAAADAFRTADEQLVRLTKVYGGLAATSSTELAKVRKDVSKTATELSKGYGSSFNETLALAADIAATGKQGNELLGSIKETTRLAVLGEVSRQDAMKATLAIQTAFKQNTTELSDSINFLNAVENQTSTTLQDLVEAIPKAGPVIKGLGGNVKDLALYLTAMKEGGISAAEGANALKSGLASLINPTKVATNMFAGFGIDLKNIVQKNAGNVTQTILDLQAALDTLNPLQKQQALEQLFGKFQFARMNALFSNLGKQGSQTLQVIDLMKASTQDLANIAGRELTQVTESASGKYRRAVEGLKADLAGIGDQFLTINTQLIKFLDGIVKFTQSLPDPIKKVLSFVGMLTAGLGPIIMLTGVLGNFFGYIIKGAYHFKALFKGAEGWKLLTPEILAANKAGDLAEQTFYSDAKAAAVLNQSLQALIASYNALQVKVNTGVIPTSVAQAANLTGVGRQVNPASKYISDKDTRQMSHLNPVSAMTDQEKMAQTMFGVVPGASKVNQSIGAAPQMYMLGDIEKIQGASAMKGVSTGIVGEEAAKWHSMTAALGMQSKAELARLKRDVIATGTITNELAQAYEAMLPKMNDIVKNAATASEAIVMDLKANKINAQQARAKIITLNAETEALMAQAAQDVAAGLGRNINVTQVPMLNQPVIDPRTGKSNMKELLKKGRTRSLTNAIARALGVKTYGASYSIETTMPKKFAQGNIVPGTGNTDIVPAMLTPGEFVVNKSATQRYLPLLQALNGPGSDGPGYQFGSTSAIRNMYQGRELAHLTEMMYTSGLSANQMAMVMRAFGVNIEDVKNPTARTGSSLFAAYHKFFNQGTNNGNLDIDQALDYLKGKQVFDPKNGMVSHDPNLAYRHLMMDLGVPESEMNKFASNMDKAIIQKLESAKSGGARMLADNPKNAGQLGTSVIGNAISDYVDSLENPEMSKKIKTLKLPGEFRIQREGRSSSDRYFPKVTGKISTMLASIIAKKRMPQKMPNIANIFKAGKIFDTTQIEQDRISAAMRSRMKFAPGAFRPIRRNTGGIVPGGNIPHYARGGRVALGAAGIIAQMFGPELGSLIGGAIGGKPGAQTGSVLGTGAGYAALGSSMFSMFGKSADDAAVKTGKLKGALTGLRAGIAALPPQIKIAAVITTALVAGFIKYKQHLDEVAKTNRLAFSGAVKPLESFDAKLKKIRAGIADINAKNKDLIAANTSAGIPGTAISVKEFSALQDKVKTTYPDIIKLFNQSPRNKLVEAVAGIKAQFIAAGDSAQQASAKIAALLSQSNKSALTNAVLLNNQVAKINDLKSSSGAMLEFLSKAQKRGGTKDFVDSMLQTFSTLDQAFNEMSKKDGPLKAMESQFYSIQNSQSKNVKLTQSQIEELSKTNPILASTLNITDSIGDAYAKWRISLAGVNKDLAGLNSGELQDLAQYVSQVTDYFGKLSDVSTAQAKEGPLGSLAKTIDSYNKKQIAMQTASQKAAQNATATINEQIKLKNKQIKQIQDEANARKKALQDQQQQEDVKLQIQQQQLDYQNALASGDMTAAAAAQLNIKKLVGQQQLVMAQDAIDKTAQSKVDKLQSEIDALNAKSQTVSTSTTYTAKKSPLQDIYSQLNSLIQNISLNGGVSTVQDKQTFDILMKQLKKISPSEAAKINPSGTDYITAPGPTEIIGGNIPTTSGKDLNKLLDNTNNAIVKNTGDSAAHLKAIRDILSGRPNVGTGLGSKESPVVVAGSQYASSKYQNKDKTLTEIGMRQIIEDNQLVKGEYFQYGNKKYLVNVGYDAKLRYGKAAATPVFHNWNGTVPGPYGKEVNAILKAGTEGVYQNDYIASLKQQSSSNGNVVNVGGMTLNFTQLPDNPRQFGRDLMDGLKSGNNNRLVYS